MPRMSLSHTPVHKRLFVDLLCFEALHGEVSMYMYFGFAVTPLFTFLWRRLFFGNKVLLFILINHGVDFKIPGDNLDILKRTVLLVNYYPGGRYEIGQDYCFCLVDRGDFSLLTSLPRS